MTIHDDDTIEDAATLMHDHDVSRLPVVARGRLVGDRSQRHPARIVSGRDSKLSRAVRRGPPSPRSTSAPSGTTSGCCAGASPAALCAVVKADGYGHGASGAVAALERRGGSASRWSRRDALRDAGIAAPILVLSEPPLDAMEAALEHDLEPAVYTREASEASRQCGRPGHDRLPST